MSWMYGSGFAAQCFANSLGPPLRRVRLEVQAPFRRHQCPRDRRRKVQARHSPRVRLAQGLRETSREAVPRLRIWSQFEFQQCCFSHVDTAKVGIWKDHQGSSSRRKRWQRSWVQHEFTNWSMSKFLVVTMGHCITWFWGGGCYIPQGWHIRVYGMAKLVGGVATWR